MSVEHLGEPRIGTYPVPGGEARRYARGVTINGGGGHVIVAFRFPILGTPYNATAILTPVSGCAGGLPDAPSRERAPPHARIVATRPPSAWHTLHRARPHAPVDGPTV